MCSHCGPRVLAFPGVGPAVRGKLFNIFCASSAFCGSDFPLRIEGNRHIEVKLSTGELKISVIQEASM